jgi:DNA-binding MarR family transcriptional regulator
MADPKKHANLFLHQDSLHEAVELLFFAYRDFTGVADAILAEHGFGRAHHRVLHFVAQAPGLSVSELLATLRITKQSLSRVLKQLVELEYVTSKASGQDGRRRELTLTAKGQDLQERLAQAQQDLILSAYEQAEASSVDGFRKVMLGLIQDPVDRARFAAQAPQPGRLRSPRSSSASATIQPLDRRR